MKNENKQQALFNIYGAKEAASGNGVIITLVRGDKDNQEFANIYLAYGKQSKTKFELNDTTVCVEIPILNKQTKKGNK